jgi:hypothetical protein
MTGSATTFVNSTSDGHRASLPRGPGSLKITCGIRLVSPQFGDRRTNSAAVRTNSPQLHYRRAPAFTLTITGTGFASTPTALWNGAELLTQFSTADPTRLAAAVPANLLAVAGVAAITVRNPGGATSNSLTFIITEGPVKITSLQPSTAVARRPFTTINGSGFNSISTVQWNQTPLPTTFVLAQLTAQVPAALVIMPDRRTLPC